MKTALVKTTAHLVLPFLAAVNSPVSAELKGITADEAQTLMSQGAPLVDIRTPQEWQATGIIPGSQKLMFFDASGHYDAAAWLKSLKTLAPNIDQPVILVCRSGNRSSTVGKMLSDEMGYQHVYHIEKGIRGWAAEGNALAKPPCVNC
jgi:rhodanese-related sulfurtransferase